MITKLVMGMTVPRKGTPLHAHHCFEMVLYLKGRGETRVDGRAFGFKPGAVFLIPPRMDHEETSTSWYQSIWIQFFGEAPRQLLHVEPPRGKELIQLSALMLARWNELAGDPWGDPSILALGESLVHWARALGRATPLPPAVEAYRRSILSNLKNPDYRVQADPCQGMTPHHLARVFKASMGVSPRQFLIARRLREARDLLSLGEHGVAEVARQYGFQDPFHFSKAFRKHYGFPPKMASGATNRLLKNG